MAAAERAPGRGSGVFDILRCIREDSHPLLLALLYVILAMPFVYRALDAGIRSIDAQTLVEAARNLGAGWPTVLFRVLVPCLRTAIINAGVPVLRAGHGRVHDLLDPALHQTVPGLAGPTADQSGQVQAAVSVFSLLLVEVLLLLIGALNWRRAAEKKG